MFHNSLRQSAIQSPCRCLPWEMRVHSRARGSSIHSHHGVSDSDARKLVCGEPRGHIPNLYMLSQKCSSPGTSPRSVCGYAAIKRASSKLMPLEECGHRICGPFSAGVNDYFEERRYGRKRLYSREFCITYGKVLPYSTSPGVRKNGGFWC
jgi:hypothetical protein